MNAALMKIDVEGGEGNLDVIVPWTPDMLSPLAGWWEASGVVASLGTPVADWPSVWGAIAELTQANAPARPTLQAEEGRPHVDFGGVGDWMDFDAAALAGASGVSLVIAVKLQVANTGNFIAMGLVGSGVRQAIHAGGLSGRALGDVATTTMTTPFLSPFVWNIVIGTIDFAGHSMALFVNGVELAQQATGFTAGSMFNSPTGRIGASLAGSSNALMTVRAAAVFGAPLTLANRQRVEGYLAHTQGLTGILPNDHPYKNTFPQVA